jgi:hypothetical protein
VQINLARENNLQVPITGLAQLELPRTYEVMQLELPRTYEVIYQSRADLERAEEILAANREHGSNLSIIHDGSGGSGKRPTNWPSPYPGLNCGYAGGIAPANIADYLQAGSAQGVIRVPR